VWIRFGYRYRGAQTSATPTDYHYVVRRRHRGGSHLEGFVLTAALVPQHLAVMPYRPDAHASVVVNMPDLTTSTGVFAVVEGQAIVVAFDMVIALVHPPAGCLLDREMRGRRGHRPASSGFRRVI
jgi:hypothetical protein